MKACVATAMLHGSQSGKRIAEVLDSGAAVSKGAGFRTLA